MNITKIKSVTAMSLVALLLLSGCADGDPSNAKKVSDSDSSNEYEFDTATINGMDCIILKNRTYGGNKTITFDCDWSSKHKTGP